MREKSEPRRARRRPVRPALTAAFALAAGLALAACRDTSVVNEAGAPATPAATAGPASSPAAAPSPAASAPPPAPSPATPAEGPGPAATPGGGRHRQPTMTNAPIQYSPAKIPTPTPEPFAPQPTPTVVVKEGKVVQQWPAPPEAGQLVNPVKNRPNAAETGRALYLQKCVDCHGREGKGNGWMSRTVARAPTNLASQMVQANTDGELFWKVTNGRPPMPAHRARFDDEQRWYIVAFLRTLK